MLSWLPDHPDFRGALKVAMEASGAVEILPKLLALSQHRLDYLQTIQVERALNRVPAEEVSGFSRVRLAILASSTVDHLVPAIRIGALRRGLLLDVYVGQYGQYRQELLDPSSPLHPFEPQVVLLSLGAP